MICVVLSYHGPLADYNLLLLYIDNIVYVVLVGQLQRHLAARHH